MINEFDYLEKNSVYLDNACQSLRPISVINALLHYYKEYNSCGGRAKHKWGTTTDEKVAETRESVLKFLKLSNKDYFVSFTLNTTYGINLILSQINSKYVDKIMTSDIEHNSPFLSTILFARRNNVPREVIYREEDGSIDISKYNFKNALIVVSSSSNIDGRKLINIEALVNKVHKDKGIIIIDAAQTMAHSSELLYKTKADAVCFSAHKMYAPSLGGMIVRKDLLKKIDASFIGGGMVNDVLIDDFKLSYFNKEHIHTIFESGLQPYGEIIALGAAIKWLTNLPADAHIQLEENTKTLYDFFVSKETVVLLNKEPNPTMSFYVKGLDSHLLGIALGDENIMARTGYFCAHYYLDHIKRYPPLIRFSLGYHTTKQDIERVINILERIVK